MEKLLLGPFFPDEKLNVVDHQHVDVAVTLSEIRHFVVSDGVDDLVRKLLGRQVRNTEVRAFGHMVPDRIEEMGLAQPDAAVNEEGVVRLSRLLRDRHTGRMGKLISRSYDEILERIFRVELNAPAGFHLPRNFGYI